MLKALLNLRFAFQGSYLKALGFADIPSDVITDDVVPFSFGTGAGQVDVGYQGQITIVNSSTPLVLDLSGSLKDPAGDASAMVKLKVMYLRNRATGVGEILTWGGGSNPIANLAGRVGPGGRHLLADPSAAGFLITPSTADNLTFNILAGAGIPVDVAFFGTSV